MSQEELTKAIQLNGYTAVKTKSPIIKTIDGVYYEVTTYQGEHSNEYVLRDPKTGICQLYYKGLRQLCWVEEGTKKPGGFITYKQGEVIQCEDWNGILNKKVFRFIVNKEDKMEMKIIVEKDNHVTYRGGFDDILSMKRDGVGIEYDPITERSLRFGVWKDDELFQVFQEFESEHRMLEYEVEEESNADITKRNLIYDGDYEYDEDEEVYVRNGIGFEIENGVAINKGEWRMGEKISSIPLHNGWFAEKNEKKPAGWGRKLRVVIRSSYDWNHLDVDVTEIVVPSNSCNESDLTTLDLSRFKRLKSVEIGDDCFQHVKEVNVSYLERLKTLTIGKNSFTEQKNGYVSNTSRKFHLNSCHALKELRIGRYSFSDYCMCEIKNMDRLEVIEMGDLDPEHTSYCFAYANLELRGCGTTC